MCRSMLDSLGCSAAKCEDPGARNWGRFFLAVLGRARGLLALLLRITSVLVRHFLGFSYSYLLVGGKGSVLAFGWLIGLLL